MRVVYIVILNKMRVEIHEQTSILNDDEIENYDELYYLRIWALITASSAPNQIFPRVFGLYNTVKIQANITIAFMNAIFRYKHMPWAISELCFYRSIATTKPTTHHMHPPPLHSHTRINKICVSTQ